MLPTDATEAARALGFRDVGIAERLGGGNLNFVYRIPTHEGPVILKHAAPYVARNPQIPLDPSRLGFEVRALTALVHHGINGIRLPRVLAADPANGTAVFSDLGDLPHGGQGPALDTPERFSTLGRFIARLHLDTTRWTHGFDNRTVQESRLQIQYQQVGAFLRAAGRTDRHLERRALELGERLVEGPGQCLVMGDLWLPHVLFHEKWLGVIDWELCTHGQPAQDLGHLSAHLWMAGAQRAWEAFWAAYTSIRMPTEADIRDTATHRSAEILARSIGPFRAGTRFEGLAMDDPRTQRAVDEACHQAAMPQSVHQR